MADAAPRTIMIDVIPVNGRRRWAVSVVPDPADGSLCSGTFPTDEHADLFASRLRRARGWPINDRARSGRPARQAHER